MQQLKRQFELNKTNIAPAANGYTSGFDGFLPPQNVEIEQVVLGAAMLETDAAALLMEMVQTPDVFYRDAHKAIFAAMRELFSLSQPIDMLTVCEQLSRMQQIEMVGGIGYVASLTQRINSSAHLQAHLFIVFENYLRRRLIEIAYATAKSCYDPSQDVFNIFDQSRLQIENALDTVVIKREGTGEQIVGQYLKNVSDAMQGLIPSGIECNIKAQNLHMRGHKKQNLIIYAGRPGSGKTAKAVSEARHIVLDQQKPVGIFSLEMSREELINRMVAETYAAEYGQKINYTDILDGKIGIGEYERISKIAAKLSTNLLVIDDTPNQNIQQLRSKAISMRSKYGIVALYIDYLQLVRPVEAVKGIRENQVAEVSTKLKGLAKELEIPVIALAQLSRAVEGRDDKRPVLSDLRESGQIEQDADVVIFFYRPEYYGITEDENGLSTMNYAEMIIGKFRSGKPNEIIPYYFHAGSNYHADWNGADAPESEVKYEQPVATPKLKPLPPNEEFDTCPY